MKAGLKKDSVRDYSPESRRKTAGVMDAPKYEAGVGKTGPWYPKCLATSAIPPCLRQLHNVTVHKGTSEKSSQGVALFGYQYYSPSDLQQFQTEYKVGLGDSTEMLSVRMRASLLTCCTQ